MAAISTDQEPLTLRTNASYQVSTFQFHCYLVRTSGTGEKKHISMKTLVARNSAESIQMAFKGKKFVVIQL